MGVTARVGISLRRRHDATVRALPVRGLWLGLWIAALAGCESEVLVEGGGGAGGSDSAMTASVTSGSTTTEGSGRGGGPVTCEGLCAGPANQCIGACLASCEAMYRPGCEPEADALVACLDRHLDETCAVGGACTEAAAAHGECAGEGGACVTLYRGEGPTACGATALCSDAFVAQSCAATPEAVVCECWVGNDLVAMCSQPAMTCEVAVGCCEAHFDPG